MWGKNKIKRKTSICILLLMETWGQKFVLPVVINNDNHHHLCVSGSRIICHILMAAVQAADFLLRRRVLTDRLLWALERIHQNNLQTQSTLKMRKWSTLCFPTPSLECWEAARQMCYAQVWVWFLSLSIFIFFQFLLVEGIQHDFFT